MLFGFIIILLHVIQQLHYIFATDISSEASKWEMKNRYFGFRYEIATDNLDEIVNEAIQLASKFKCFGWIQKQANDSKVVGEYRCSKNRGLQLHESLRKDYSTTTKIYKDTKIRLHFTEFKYLDESRDTCFLDTPHKCPLRDNTMKEKETIDIPYEIIEDKSEL